MAGEQSDPFTVIGSMLSKVVALPPVTTRVAVPDTFPNLAVIMAVPLATGVTRPCEFVSLLTTATSEGEELHVTDVVRLVVVLSVNNPLAVNCSVVPTAILERDGSTAIDANTAGVTVSVADSEKPP